MGMMKSAEAYYSEMFAELCNSEIAWHHDFNNSDVDDLIIYEIRERIGSQISAGTEAEIDKWIRKNPDSVEARTLLWLE